MLALLVTLLAAPQYPAFSDYVVDAAHALPPDAVESLKATSSRLDHAGIAQLAVCTVTDAMLDDAALEDYAADLFKKWGLGHGKKKADGVLILMVPGGPGHRRTKVEVGYGLEGVLPDGKVGALYDEYARPAVRAGDLGQAAVKLENAIAGVLEKDAAAGGDAAPTKDSMRGGAGLGTAAGPQQDGTPGLAVALLAMLAVLIVLATSAARRAFPGGKTKLGFAAAVGVSFVALVTAGTGVGWLVLVAGVIVNTVVWISIRAHKCPRDGSWMTIDEEIVDEPTYYSQGLAHVVQACTNRACGYVHEFDKVLPRKQVSTVSGGGWGGGGGGGGGGDGFSGGGGGDSGGGGISRSD